MSNSKGKHPDDQFIGGVVVAKPRSEVKEPKLFRVLLHNDDYTPMDFVVDVIQKVFKRSREEASTIMMDVHNKGHGVCGVYTYEIAETKVATVDILSKQNEYPLKCSMESV